MSTPSTCPGESRDVSVPATRQESSLRGTRPGQRPAALVVGSLLLLAGAALLVLVLMARGTGLPWTIRKPLLDFSVLWGFAGAAMVGGGVRLLWVSEHPHAAWKPEQPGRRFHNLVLYTRRECPLCDEAQGLLSAYRAWLPPVVVVDIDHDPDLWERFDTCVPVVEIDGKVRFRGRIHEPLLRRLIQGTPPAV